MRIFLPIISIFAIAALAWAGKRVLSLRLCPICAGVAGTWAWMLIARTVGAPVDAVFLALLMGGSVVGVAYQAEKRLPPARSPVIWKMLFIPAGFVAAWGLVAAHLSVAAGAGVFAVVVALAFLRRPRERRGARSHADELEKKMNSCC